MKTNTALRVVENNAFASKDFTIQASGKMFHMVISGLYSNKPQSITREIWSNAYDAHCMVDKQNVPFEVTFPTLINPVFSVRDFGPGIAHEDMEGFYTVLGHSTKENTNKAVGKWGVGRMSPMSYTDTFSVVSRHKGMIAYYSIVLGPDGSPQLHVLAPPTPTKDEDGLEVSFPVKREDIGQFQRAAETVSYGFSVSPVVTNSQEKTFAPIKKVMEGKDYYLYKDQRISGPHAQMGCVLYPIPRQYVSVYRNIVYQFDIGDLEVTASRESLSFGPNDPTEKSIRDKCKAVEEDIFGRLQTDVEAQDTEFKAARMNATFIRLFSKNCTWKGKLLSRYWTFSAKDIALHCSYRSGSNKVVGFGSNWKFDVLDQATIFVQDTGDTKGCVRAANRIASALKPNTSYIWIKADLKNPVAKAELDATLASVDLPVLYVKDLPDTGAAKRAPRTKVVVSLMSDRGSLEKYDMDDVAFTKGGYYNLMSNNHVDNYRMFRKNLVMKALVGDNIIFVPKTLWKKFEGASQWKPWEPAFNALLDKHEDEVRKHFQYNYKENYAYSALQPLLSVPGIVGDFARKVQNHIPEKMFKGVDRDIWKEVFRVSDKKLWINLAQKEYETILKKYPLLKYYNKDAHQNFVDYIQLIDKR